MKRFHIAPPAQLELVRIALDQAAGLRDATGAPVVVQHKVMRNGVVVGTIASDIYCARYGVQPTTLVAPPVLGDDGTAALELPLDPLVDAQLGKTRGGVAIPSAGALVQVASAAEHDKLPAGVMRALDDQALVGLTDAEARALVGATRAAEFKQRASDRAAPKGAQKGAIKA